jgi:hypothetical protein
MLSYINCFISKPQNKFEMKAIAQSKKARKVITLLLLNDPSIPSFKSLLNI